MRSPGPIGPHGHEFSNIQHATNKIKKHTFSFFITNYLFRELLGELEAGGTKLRWEVSEALPSGIVGR